MNCLLIANFPKFLSWKRRKGQSKKDVFLSAANHTTNRSISFDFHISYVRKNIGLGSKKEEKEKKNLKNFTLH